MTSKTDHTREASVPAGLRTDAQHPEFAEGDLQAKRRPVVAWRSFLKAVGLAGADTVARSGTVDRPDAPPARHRRRLLELRGHRWTPAERAILISLVAIAMGSVFVTTYSLTLGDPIPRHINAAIVGDGDAHPGPVDAIQRVAGGKLDFHLYPSLPAALRAIDSQNVYAALDVASQRPTLYVASAAGASVARVLERIATVDPGVRVRDTHPLSVHDPNGLNILYLMLVTTIVGFLTIFQVRANAGELRRRHQIAVVVGLALTASLVLTLVDGPLLNRLTLPVPETWGILALNLLAAASFTSLMAVLIGRWAILPTFLFVVVLGNASSGGAVSPPLLPPAFAFFSQWLPAGSTVTALRDAIYFTHHQHAQPIVVLATWAILVFTAWLLVSRRREARITHTEKEPLQRTLAAF
jgi:hypothetical protein